MRLTTKGRYGMRLVLDIAQHEGEGPVSINEISQRQNVSAKYLERLVGDLRRAGFVRSQRGRDGGHMLALTAEEITVGAIVRALEGDSFLLACCKNRHTCARSGSCLTRAIWIAADQAMYEKLNSVSVRNILDDSRKCLAARDAATAFNAAFAVPKNGARARVADDICPAPPYSMMQQARCEDSADLCCAELGKVGKSGFVQAVPKASAGALPVSAPAPQGHVAAVSPARVRRMTRRLFLRRPATTEAAMEEPTQAQAEVPCAESAAVPVAIVPRGRKVLVAEPDENILAEHLEGLRQAGYEACGAVDGATAMALLPLEQPDLVAVDLHLSDSWGPRLCGELTREGAGTVPVLVLSAVPDMHLGLRGAVATIPHRAGVQELLRAVNLALKAK
jgi:rrf2 family protein (putative transcriptional regulator)